MAFLQSRCTDYPYKRWKLRSTENQKAILDIETRRGLLLTFEIGPDYLKLLIEDAEGAPESYPELRHLKNRPLQPGYLLLELSKCGIHLLPRNEDVEQAGISLKDFQAEERAIADISSSVRAFAYRSCRWNSSIDADNVVVKIRENLEFDREFFEDHEPDWRYVNWWPNKVAYVRCCDLDETADMRIAAGQETHSLLFQALQAAGTTLASEEAAERSQQYSYIDFIDTVKKTLRLTRVLAFT